MPPNYNHDLFTISDTPALFVGENLTVAYHPYHPSIFIGADSPSNVSFNLVDSRLKFDLQWNLPMGTIDIWYNHQWLPCISIQNFLTLIRDSIPLTKNRKVDTRNNYARFDSLLDDELPSQASNQLSEEDLTKQTEILLTDLQMHLEHCTYPIVTFTATS